MDNSPEKKSRLQEILESLKGKAKDITGADSPEEFYNNFRGAAKEGIEEDVLPGVQKHLGDEAAAGTATALDMGLDYVAPEDPKDLALAALPMGRFGKLGKAEARAAGRVEGLGAMNYGAMRAEDKAARAAARRASEEAAPALVYGQKGSIKYMTPEELAQLKAAKPK